MLRPIVLGLFLFFCACKPTPNAPPPRQMQGDDFFTGIEVCIMPLTPGPGRTKSAAVAAWDRLVAGLAKDLETRKLARRLYLGHWTELQVVPEIQEHDRPFPREGYDVVLHVSFRRHEYTRAKRQDFAVGIGTYVAVHTVTFLERPESAEAVSEGALDSEVEGADIRSASAKQEPQGYSGPNDAQIVRFLINDYLLRNEPGYLSFSSTAVEADDVEIPQDSPQVLRERLDAEIEAYIRKQNSDRSPFLR